MKREDSQLFLADVVVGARGWLHDSWTESFYPEDIPEDWRLGFYANEFNTLLVPWSQWSESVEDIKVGLDDTEEDFHLYLELPMEHQALPVHLQDIRDSVTGLVYNGAELKKWQAEAASSNISLFTTTSPNDDIFQRFVSSTEMEKAQLALIQSSNIDDLAMMREQLEKALQGVESRLDFIFIDATPDLEAMQNTRMIAELMGA